MRKQIGYGDLRDFKPSYMPWYEADFWADRKILRWAPIERHFYRALLLQAPFCDTRPFLPDDDNELWVLADADSLEHWREHRNVVVSKFTAFTNGEGVKLLRNKRIDEEWAIMLRQLENAKAAGLASAKKRAASNDRSTDAEPPSAGRSTQERVRSVQESTGQFSSAQHGGKEQGSPSSDSNSSSQSKTPTGSTQTGMGIQALIDLYPKPCPEGKLDEWFELFGRELAGITLDAFHSDEAQAHAWLSRKIKAYAKKCENDPRVMNPAKFFSQWLADDYDLAALKKKQAEATEDDQQTLDYMSGEAEVDGLDDAPPAQKFNVDELDGIDDDEED